MIVYSVVYSGNIVVLAGGRFVGVVGGVRSKEAGDRRQEAGGGNLRYLHADFRQPLIYVVYLRSL